MSGHLIITPEDRARIQTLVLEARGRMMPWSVAKKIAKNTLTDTLTLEERRISSAKLQRLRKGYEVEHIQLGSYDVAFSFEEQPRGIFRHLSASSSNPGKVPNEYVMAMLVREFGFSGWPPTRPYRVWIEEYEPGRNAVNIAEQTE